MSSPVEEPSIYTYSACPWEFWIIYLRAGAISSLHWSLSSSVVYAETPCKMQAMMRPTINPNPWDQNHSIPDNPSMKTSSVIILRA